MADGLFIRVDIADPVHEDPDLVRRLIEVCPVDIFDHAGGGGVRTVAENLDECTL